MNKPSPVQETQRVCYGRKHLGSLSRSERPHRQDLPKILFSEFHHHIQKSGAVDLAASAFKQLHQVRMRKFGNTRPTGKLRIFVQVLRGKELDGGLARSPARALGQKNRAMLRAAEPLPQWELLIDN